MSSDNFQTNNNKLFSTQLWDNIDSIISFNKKENNKLLSLLEFFKSFKNIICDFTT